MEIFQGNEGFGAVGIGTVRVIRKDISRKQKDVEPDKDEELKKYESAKIRVINELKAEKAVGSLTASTRLMLLDEHQLEDAIIARILNRGCRAYEAVSSAGRYLEDILSAHEDSYVSSKSTDIKQLAKMLLSYMDGYTGIDALLSDETVIVADSLNTSDFLKLDRVKLKGLVVERSTSNSHVAIMAKALGVPTILGCEISDEWNGRRACVDGSWRALYIDPDESIITDMKERIISEVPDNEELLRLRGKRCITGDGREIKLFANISSSAELLMAQDNDAEGVGLYRTEPSFVNRAAPPGEEELFTEYRNVATALGNKPFIIRTIDLAPGRDAPYLPFSGRQNSSMGLRGIRLCLKHQDIFKTQIRAILRAAVFGDVHMMLPMITGIEELADAEEIINDCFRELEREEIPCRMTKLGIMIETPAAVMMSDELSARVGFVSIGTNDLTQYTLCVDREDTDASEFCDYNHPAVMKMIEMTVKNARKHGTPVGICGELAGDPRLLPYFLDLGIDVLSVVPGKILDIRKRVRSM